MTCVGPDRAGFFLRHHREELARIWRVARAAARPGIFPGLLDDLVPAFLDAGGALLARGGPPGEVWRALAGVVRWPPALAAAEAKTEWALLGEVVAAACESMSAHPGVAAWLRDAASACRDGLDAAAHGRAVAPPGLLLVFVYSPMVPRRVPEQHAPNA